MRRAGREGHSGRGSRTQPRSPVLRAALGAPPPPPPALPGRSTYLGSLQSKRSHCEDELAGVRSRCWEATGSHAAAPLPGGSPGLPAHPTLLSRSLWGCFAPPSKAANLATTDRAAPSTGQCVVARKSARKEAGNLKKTQAAPKAVLPAAGSRHLRCSAEGEAGLRGPPSKLLPATSRDFRCTRRWRAGNLGPGHSTRPWADARPSPLPPLPGYGYQAGQ